jgi:chromate transporter
LKALEIFWLCFRTSLVSFAGVYGAMPEYARLFVQERGWVTSEQLVQDYVVAQTMPGPNMVLAVMIGHRAAGLAGAGAAFAGTYTPPLLMMSIVVAALARYRRFSWVRRAELAIRPVVIGLMIGAVAAILREQATRYGVLITLVVGAAAAVAQRRARVNPLLVLAGAGALFALLTIAQAHVYPAVSAR